MVLGAGIERQRSLEEAVVDRQRDHHVRRSIAAGDVAVLQKVLEDGAGLGQGSIGSRRLVSRLL
jgi:hypothetical protein